MRGGLLAAGVFSEAELGKMEDDAHKRIEEALKFAQDGKYPDIATIYDDVYA
jgi:TPP-dependent pyruvate/acetoin dehydrogenase alpha subunit